MPTFIALVRPPASSFAGALSSHPQKDFINPGLALEQHMAYVQALRSAGAQTVTLDPLPDFPDAVFVEDNAVIFDHGALICRMKEKSRRDEVQNTAREIEKYRSLKFMEPPATLDGGDVLNTGDTLFVGLSTRTNREALDQLARFSGKPVVPVEVRKGLHLKTSASYLGNHLLVLDSANVDAVPFSRFDRIEVAPEESYAANCLALGNIVILPAGHPRTKEMIREKGYEVIEVPMSEFEKADGGVTCLSLIIPEVPA